MGFFDRWFGQPKLEDVARVATKWLRAQGFERVEFHRERTEIVAYQGDSPHQIFLGNLLHDYQRTPRRERAALVERFMSGLTPGDEAVPERYEDARSKLMPVVRGAANIDIARLTSLKAEPRGDGLRLASKPLVGDLVVALVADLPNSMAYVNEDHLTKWSVSFEQALDDALDNLRGLPEHGGWDQLAHGVWSGQWGDSYESSRILLPDLIHRLGVSNPVAMVPFRNTLLVTSAHNEAGIALMANVTSAMASENNRWLSFRLLRLDGTRWTEAQAPADARGALRALDLHGEADAYASQKQLLEDILAARNEDVFVATCQLMQKEDGSVSSYAVWSEGVDALLPRADAVVFTHHEGQVLTQVIVPWATVQEHFAGLMERTDHEPVRYRVRSYPDRTLLAQLGEPVQGVPPQGGGGASA